MLWLFAWLFYQNYSYFFLLKIYKDKKCLIQRYRHLNVWSFLCIFYVWNENRKLYCVCWYVIPEVCAIPKTKPNCMLYWILTPFFRKNSKWCTRLILGLSCKIVLLCIVCETYVNRNSTVAHPREIFFSQTLGRVRNLEFFLHQGRVR